MFMGRPIPDLYLLRDQSLYFTGDIPALDDAHMSDIKIVVAETVCLDKRPIMRMRYSIGLERVMRIAQKALKNCVHRRHEPLMRSEGFVENNIIIYSPTKSFKDSRIGPTKSVDRLFTVA